MGMLAAEQSATAAFVAGKVLHELGNPAAAIKSNLSYLLDVLPALGARFSGREKETFDDALAAIAETEQANDALVGRLEQMRAADTNFAVGASTDLVTLLPGFIGPGLLFSGEIGLPDAYLDVTGQPSIWGVLLFRIAAMFESTPRSPVQIAVARVGEAVTLRFTAPSLVPADDTPLRAVAPFVLARKGPDVRIDLMSLDDLVGRLRGSLQREDLADGGVTLILTVPRV